MVRRDILLLVLKNVKYTDVFLLYAIVFDVSAPAATAIVTFLTGFFTVIRFQDLVQSRRR